MIVLQAGAGGVGAGRRQRAGGVRVVAEVIGDGVQEAVGIVRGGDSAR